MNFHLDSEPVQWESPAELDIPERGEVHIWRFDLDIPPPGFKLDNNWLSQAEMDRADGFRFFLDGLRWRYARAYLRLTLANYLKIEPRAVQFEYTEYGKPFLPEYSSLTFNLSHSLKWGVLACSNRLIIGSDVEYEDTQSGVFDSVVTSMYTKAQANYLSGLEPSLHRRAFYRIWTQKEAVIKAEGSGLQLPLNKLEIEIIDKELIAHFKDWEEAKEDDRWRVKAFDVDDLYPAALAWRQKEKVSKILYYDWLFV